MTIYDEKQKKIERARKEEGEPDSLLGGKSVSFQYNYNAGVKRNHLGQCETEKHRAMAKSLLFVPSYADFCSFQ